MAENNKSRPLNSLPVTTDASYIYVEQEDGSQCRMYKTDAAKMFGINDAQNAAVHASMKLNKIKALLDQLKESDDITAEVALMASEAQARVSAMEQDFVELKGSVEDTLEQVEQKLAELESTTIQFADSSNTREYDEY